MSPYRIRTSGAYTEWVIWYAADEWLKEIYLPKLPKLPTFENKPRLPCAAACCNNWKTQQNSNMTLTISDTELKGCRIMWNFMIYHIAILRGANFMPCLKIAF